MSDSKHPVRETFWVGEGFDVYHVRLRWADPKPGDSRPAYWVDFEVFDVVVTHWDGEAEPRREFHQKGYTSCPGEETDDADKAETVAEGFVKWDGCTQWHVDGAHTDSKVNMAALCEAIQRARARAIEVMDAEEYA